MSINTNRVETDRTETLVCSHCDVHVSGEDHATTDAGDILCPDCAGTCVRCECTCIADDMSEVQIERGRRRYVQHWCESCTDDHAYRCADCSYRFDELSHNNSHDERICSYCAESYFTCDECDNTRPNEDYGGDGRCQSCCGNDSSRVINDYSYRPHAIFHPSRAECDATRAYGVELEVESVSGSLEDNAEEVQELTGDFAYLKYDGSLNNGFEIVSHPGTLAYHRTAWEEFFAKRPRGLRSYDTSTCGLHVHASKRGLTPLQIAKIVFFVSAHDNSHFIRRIAGRDANRYCKKVMKKLGDCHRDDDRDRYHAVNLCPSHTVEFRLFRGTLKRESFFRALEFVDAIIKYCEPAARSIEDATSADAFTSWLLGDKKHKDAWPNLYATCHDYVRGNDAEEGE